MKCNLTNPPPDAEDQPTNQVVIIGAGPAGLTAAYELLTRTNLKPIVLEATDCVGGISRTTVHNGNRIDIGGHRFFSKSDRVMAWWQQFMPLQGTNANESIALKYQGQTRELDGDDAGPDPQSVDEVMLVRSRKSRIYFLGKLFDYPLSLSLTTVRGLGLARMSRIATSYFRSAVRPIRPESNLEEFLAHPTEAYFLLNGREDTSGVVDSGSRARRAIGCAGGFLGMAQVSNHDLHGWFADDRLKMPGKTESSSNGVDLGLFCRFHGLDRDPLGSAGARFFHLGIF